MPDAANATMLVVAATSDPITAFLTKDWASLGGWSLFILLCMTIVIGAFREWWVPGPRHRRVETAAAEQSKTLAVTAEALKEQTQANEIVKHFFEKTIPTRGESRE